MFNIIFFQLGERGSRQTSAPHKQGESKPRPATHRAEVKRGITQSARSLFNRYGFDNLPLEQIMAGAGLTHGGFYSYFESKNDLYAEVLGCFFTDPEWKSCCPIVALPSDAARSGKSARRAFEAVFKAMVDVLERSLIDKNRSRRTRGLASAAFSVGGMVVASSMVERAIADELRDGCMSVALKLGAGITRQIEN